MSPISFFQRHPRADLSAYLDSELTSAANQRLEAHIASCAPCATHLEELREARSVLRSIPEAPAPRSFALTPEMARDARPVRQALPARRVQPLVNGLRMTSAGLAVALAVVVVIGVSGGGSESSDDSGLASLRVNDSTEQYSADAPTASMDLLHSDGSGGDAGAASTQTPLTSAADDDGLVPGSAPGSAGSVGGAGDIPPATGGSLSVPTEPAGPAASPVDVSSGETDGNLDRDDNASATDIPKAVSGEFDSATPVPGADSLAYDSTEGDSSVGTLTIVAIVLGVLLAAALIGSIAASRLARKTP